jgi:hypothetical protein
VLRAHLSNSSRRARRQLGFVLAFALLFAQAGALLHATSHAAEKRDTTGLHSQLCGQCLSFSTVFALASGGASIIAPLAPSVEIYVGVATAPLTGQRPASAFRSRAPPAPR